MGHEPDNQKVIDGFWNFCSFYKSGNYNLWYITDEVGLGVCHSENPNVKMIPFLTVKGQEMISYSIFWPIKEISKGHQITRDAIPVALTEKRFREIYTNIVFKYPNNSQQESLTIFENVNLSI